MSHSSMLQKEKGCLHRFFQNSRLFFVRQLVSSFFSTWECSHRVVHTTALDSCLPSTIAISLRCNAERALSGRFVWAVDFFSIEKVFFQHQELFQHSKGVYSAPGVFSTSTVFYQHLRCFSNTRKRVFLQHQKGVF